MKSTRAILIVLLLFAGMFALATTLQPRALTWTDRANSDSALKLLLGDSRRMFANHFFVQADVSFHSGYYPSIFDQARQEEDEEKAMARAQQGETNTNEGRTSQAGGFLGKPTDWIDRFGRHFRVTEHTHLEGKNVREILPWLKISAELDPQRIETYTVAAYWLRSIGKPEEAEQFLREGLRANPNSYEILFELGRLYMENRHDPEHAINIWKLALRRWRETEQPKKKPDFDMLDKITMHLASAEENEGHYAEAIHWMEQAKTHSPSPEAVQEQIDNLRAKISRQK
ncbi:MAG TPA: tetratricopeptide repeat protein [Verrucomicrobiae bacterium]|nr:tetratricopeptide repeat protein [Verrucomicrobiae bacterium]